MRIQLHVGIPSQTRDGPCIGTQDAVHELLDSMCQVGCVLSRVQAVGIKISDPSERDVNAQLARSFGRNPASPEFCI